MLGIASIVIMSIVLLGLTSLMVVLFTKHLNVMYEFIQEILKVQTVLYQEILSIKIILNHLKGQEMIEGKEASEEVRNTAEKNNTYALQKRENERAEFNHSSKSSGSSSNINNLDSSEISDKGLEDLLKGKDLMFRKEVNVNSNEDFINTDINI